MNYINLKYLGNGARRTAIMGMGGFELEATTKYDNGRKTFRKGQLCKEFKLMIPPDGNCRVPDTEFNRSVLKNRCNERLEIVNTIDKKTNEVVSEKVKMPATFELLSNVDLNEAAPDSAETTYTEEELNEIVAKKLEEAQAKAKPREIKAPKAKKAIKKVIKKAPKIEEVVAETVEPDLV